jgi:hypothetical protein
MAISFSPDLGELRGVRLSRQRLVVGVGLVVDLVHRVILRGEAGVAGVGHARRPLAVELGDGGCLEHLVVDRAHVVEQRLVLHVVVHVVALDLVLCRSLASGRLPVVGVLARLHLLLRGLGAVEHLLVRDLFRLGERHDVVLVRVDEGGRLLFRCRLLLRCLGHAVPVCRHPLLGVAVFAVVFGEGCVLRLVDGHVVEALLRHARCDEVFDLVLPRGLLLLVVAAVDGLVVLGQRGLLRVELLPTSSASAAPGERE